MIKSSQKALAEFFGTFCLVFCGPGAVVVDEAYGGINHIGVSIIFGLIVCAMIFSFGKISGAHINPAVSIAFWVKGKLSLSDTLKYVLAQVLGGILASAFLLLLFPDTSTLGQTNPAGSLTQTLITEVVITFILMTVILRIPDNEHSVMYAALSVGFAVMLLAMLAGPICGASMNPARSIGPALVSGDVVNLWIYIVAPIAGALLAVPVNKVWD